MKLAHACVKAECYVNFVVRDEVGDKEKAFREGRS